jgi:drug/metabolite transporter (DMT)-like permease
VQFIFVTVIGLPGQFDRTRPPFFLKPNKVPIRRWMVNIFLFFSINSLNNHAFSYDISVPVHIILRSGGSITTMIAGSLYGKKYSRIQIIAVLLLTVGVITAAVSDAQTKVCVRLLHVPTTLARWILIIGGRKQKVPSRLGIQALSLAWSSCLLRKCCRR